MDCNEDINGRISIVYKYKIQDSMIFKVPRIQKLSACLLGT